jgi:hypothetical protein
MWRRRSGLMKVCAVGRRVPSSAVACPTQAEGIDVPGSGLSDIDEFGQLVSAVGAWALRADDRGNGHRFDEYCLNFERASVVITAVPDDDTISIHVGQPTSPYQEDISAREPWQTLVGCGVIWAWSMTNQRGFRDGYQIEFGRPGECWAVQFMSEGSALSLRAIAPSGRLWNQVDPLQ